MTSLSAVTLELEQQQSRGMLLRQSRDAIRIVGILEPGRDTRSCLVCCGAPSCCPLCALFPCCDDADYVKQKREASKYITIREHSLEWNDPEIVCSSTSLCIDPCLYSIKDRVHVVYFDDVMLDRITDQTRFCNECRTCLCGGRGERIRFDSTCCSGLCLRSSFPCPCIPAFCPAACFPCAWRHEIYVKDASKALYEIKAAIRGSKNRVKDPSSSSSSSSGSVVSVETKSS